MTGNAEKVTLEAMTRTLVGAGVLLRAVESSEPLIRGLAGDSSLSAPQRATLGHVADSLRDAMGRPSHG